LRNNKGTDGLPAVLPQNADAGGPADGIVKRIGSGKGQDVVVDFAIIPIKIQKDPKPVLVFLFGYVVKIQGVAVLGNGYVFSAGESRVFRLVGGVLHRIETEALSAIKGLGYVKKRDAVDAKAGKSVYRKLVWR
jgi:hypothetical protein